MNITEFPLIIKIKNLNNHEKLKKLSNLILSFAIVFAVLISCEKEEEPQSIEPETHNYLSFKVTCLSSGVITPHEKCRAEIVKNGEVISSRLLDDGRYSTSDFDYENTEEIDIFVYPGYSNELLTGGYGLNPKKNPTWYVNSIDLLETNKEEGEMGHFHLGTCPNDNK